MRKYIFILILFFLLLTSLLILGVVYPEGLGRPTGVPDTWRPPELLLSTLVPTRLPGWWDRLPTPMPGNPAAPSPSQ